MPKIKDIKTSDSEVGEPAPFEEEIEIKQQLDMNTKEYTNSEETSSSEE